MYTLERLDRTRWILKKDKQTVAYFDWISDHDSWFITFIFSMLPVEIVREATGRLQHANDVAGYTIKLGEQEEL